MDKDWKDPKELTVGKLMLKKTNDFEKRAVTEKEPFCRACAKFALEDSVEAKRKRIVRETGVDYPEHKEFNKAVEDTNIECFFGRKYFEVVTESPITEYKILPSGEKEPYVSGFWVEFKCNSQSQKHNYSMRLNVAEYEALKMKGKGKVS